MAANGDIIPIVGTKRCKFQLNNMACFVELIIAKGLSNQCLLGMDILSTCPSTRQLFVQLEMAVSKQLTESPTQFFDIALSRAC